MRKQFNQIADAITRAVGSPSALVIAAGIIIVWAVTGPIFNFSDTWQLVINTGTTIVTFLMVFVIQNAQNRDAKAVHLKLDELIRSIEGARNKMVLAENLTEEEQDQEIQKLIKTVEHEPGGVQAVTVVAEVGETEAKTAETAAATAKAEADKSKQEASRAADSADKAEVAAEAIGKETVGTPRR